MAAEEKSKKSAEKPAALVAKKAFEIHHNDYHKIIQAGDDLSDVPEIYLANLKTEQVL